MRSCRVLIYPILSHLRNQQRYVIKVRAVLRFPDFLPKVLSLLQDLIQDTLQSLCFLRLFLALTVSQAFLVLNNLTNFEN